MARRVSAVANIGMIGLGVMGRNLALNLADHGYTVTGFDLDERARKRFIGEHEEEQRIIAQRADSRDASASQATVTVCDSLRKLLEKTNPPRVLILLVPAGKPVDAVCDSLIEAGVAHDDIVIDCGNSMWTDTIAREKRYRGKLTFFGSGVSGGEVGARFGPSLMPGGDREAWERLRPIWEAIAAKVDPETGNPLETGEPGKPVTGGEPCTAYIGPDGAGHYVKMVHNGIEYADMQLICEAYDLMRRGLDMPPGEIGKVFAQWNETELDSYLIEITADILHQKDPVTGAPFVDVVLDAAEQKGTGRWTAIDALNMGVPAMTITEAVFARAMSALKEERERAAGLISNATPRDGHGLSPWASASGASHDEVIDSIRAALYCSKICAYAQGFQLMRAAQSEYDWTLDFAAIARTWRGGCIIRARFLQKITEAYERDASLANLLLDEYFRDAIAARGERWRSVIAHAVSRGIPVPSFSSALAYYDSYCTATLPANLLQAQRDYFGAHGYERIDQSRGKKFHLDWPDPDRPQIER